MLVFSQAKQMLDIIAHVLTHRGLSSCRIDGSVTGRDRQEIIDGFNASSAHSPAVCLLTTKACGVGINLTGADRVVIFDPSWNPAEDRQAVDRAYRIGQRRDVVVYRLVLASSLEEKMYEKQVFKDGVRVVTEQGQSLRYFSSNETKELFRLGPGYSSEVMSRLWAKSGEELKEFDLASTEMPGVLGFTRHDTLYEEKSAVTSHGAGKAIPARPPPPTKQPVHFDKAICSLPVGQQPISAWLGNGDDFKIPKKKKNAENDAVIDLTSPKHLGDKNEFIASSDGNPSLISSDQAAPTPLDVKFTGITNDISPIPTEELYSPRISVCSDVGGRLNQELCEVDESPSVALDMTAFIADSPLSGSIPAANSPDPPPLTTSASNSFDLSLELVSLRNMDSEVDASALNLTDFFHGRPSSVLSAPSVGDQHEDSGGRDEYREDRSSQQILTILPSAEAINAPSPTCDDSNSDSEAEWDEAFGTEGSSMETNGMMIDPTNRSLFPRTDKPYDSPLVTLPRYKLSTAKSEEYNRLIKQAVSRTRTGDRLGYAQGLIAALSICDDSSNLHKALFALFQRGI